MSDSPYGNTIYSKTNGGLGTPVTSRNISDTATFGGAGAWLRYQLNWGHIETSTSTSGTPTYDWSCLDSVAYACTAAGVNLLFCLQLAPSGGAGQASPGLNRLRITATGTDVGYGGSGALYASPADFTYFAQQVATRYNGTYTDPTSGLVRVIPALQLGNEEYDTKAAKSTAAWQTGGRDDQGKRLGEMLNQAASAVKAIYSTVKLGINAIRRVPDTNYTRTHCITWLTNVMNTIGSNAQYIDWVDFHNYRQDPTLDNNSPRAQDPSYDVPQTAAGGWPYGADVPSIATRLTDMIGVLTTAGYGPSSGHPIQVWLCETGWALFDDGTRTQDPIVYVSPATCSQYYQIAADQMRTNGGSKIMYYTIDSTKKLHNYSPSYATHDVFGNAVTVTQWSDDKDSIIDVPAAGGTPVYYQPYTDFATYIATYPNWTGGGSGGSGGSGGTSGSNIIVANDSFIRSNQSGWGLASDTTDSWVQSLGTATPSILSNKGKFTGATGANNMLLGTGMLINGDFKVRFSVSTTGSLAGLVFRRIDANNQMRVEVGNNIIRFRKTVAGTGTVLTPNNTTIVISNSTNYWIHVNVSGTTYNVNVWADGTTEPNGWMITDTDSSITAAGQFGIHANPATSGSSVLFDTYSATTTTNTYYLSPTGSDSNNGSSAHPWQTLTKVKNNTQAGDSVFFANGNYTGGVSLTTSGTASAPITLMATNKQKATIIEPGGAGLGTALLTVNADNIIVDSFEATGADCQYGIQLLNNYDVVQNCFVHDICNTLTLSGSNEGYGIGAPGASGFAQVGTVIQANLLERVGPKTSGVIVANSKAHNIYAMTANAGGAGVVQNNISILASGYGIALYHNPNNWIVTNNTVINCKTGGIECYGDIANSYIADFNTIQNNILVENGSSGYYPAIWSQSDNCGSHNVFRKNLAWHPTQTAIYDFTTANTNPFQTATNLPNANPNFVKYINDGTGDYHLSSVGSPAVDTGTLSLAPLVDYDGTTRPQGAGIDVGAYEATGSLIITIGSTGVIFDEDSFKITPKVNERWRCQFDVLDYTGTQFFSYGEQVTVTDSNLGRLFTGFIATVHQDKSKVYGSPATIHQIDCIDNHHLADKRTSNRLYTFPQPAGKIATDMVHDVLKAEGVIAHYASHSDTAETDWAQGALTNVVATPNLGGDLELGALSNVSQTITANSDWQNGTYPFLQINGGDVYLAVTSRNWNNGSYSSQTLWGNGHPTQFVDKKGVFNLTCQSVSSVFGGQTQSRLDFAGTIANGTIECDINMDDTLSYHSITYRTTVWDNVDGHWAYAVEFSGSHIQLQLGTNGGGGTITTLASSAVTLGLGWYTLRIDFSSGSHKVYINGTQYLSATDSTWLSAGYIGLRNRNLNTHTGSTQTMQFDNFNVSPSLTGTWTGNSSISLSSISNIVTSFISWDTSASTGTASSVEVDVSVDGGTTYTKVSNGGAMPLTPGTSGSGKNVKIKAVLSTTDLNSVPHISAINWIVTSGYTSSGTRTSIPPATYGTDTFTRANAGSWGTGSDGQTWYFDQGAGALAIASNEGTVTGSGTANFMRYGTLIASDINISVKFLLAAAGDYAGLLLRYNDTANFYRLTFGNGVFFIEKYVNGVQTTLVQQTFSQSTATSYTMRFKSKDNILNARWWLSGSGEPTTWNMTIIDNDLTGGYYGLYAAPASGSAMQFDHLSAVGVGVTPGLDLTPVGRCGSTFIGWNATVPTNTSLGVDVSLDGGSTWTDVSFQNGGPLPGIVTQPDPSVDNFSVDSSAYYTSSSGYGGAAATWTEDLTNDRIIATGGTQALYTYNNITAEDIDLFCDMDYADAGGLVWCYSDSNDYYALVVGDSQAAVGATNTVTLYKRAPVPYSTTIQGDSPLLYYRFDETSGTTVTDSSVFARNATYSGTGVTYSQTGAITGDTDTAVLLDGAAGCVTCPSGVNPNGLSAFSFEIWVNFSSVPSSARIATNSTTTTNNKGFALYYTNTGTKLNFAVGNGTTFAQASYTITVATSTWYHVVGTYDGATVTLYVNGASVATASLTGTVGNGTNPITIGCNVGASGFFPGDIDEAALYSTALSSSRILSHYNSGQGNQASSITQLAQANINFIRGTYHRIRATTVEGAITVNFDDSQVLNFIDSTPLAAGNPGLFNDGGGTARFYQLWMQQQGDDVTGIIIHTRLRLATTSSSVSPQVETLTIAAFGPQIGAGTLIPSADYRHTFVSKNLDDLSKQSDYQWWIDPLNLLYFNHRQAQPASWIPQSNTLGLPSDIILDGNLMVEVAGDLYRNRQVLTGVTNTATFVDTFIGNSNQTSFTLRYPIAPGTVPLIKKDTVPQAIGLKGTTGKDWYYAEGDSVVAQDAGNLVLTSSNTLVVTYIGTFLDTVIVDNTAAQAALQATEDGTGIVEAVEDVSKPGMMYAAAVTYANQLLARYCVTGRTITFCTNRDGLKVGSIATFYVVEENLYGVAMLITSMDITFQTQPGNTRLYQYVVQASELAPIGSWQKLLSSGLLD